MSSCQQTTKRTTPPTRPKANSMPFHISHLHRYSLASLLACQVLLGCAPPEWVDVPTGTFDPRAYDHNVRECAGQGLVFDAASVRCIEVPK